MGSQSGRCRNRAGVSPQASLLKVRALLGALVPEATEGPVPRGRPPAGPHPDPPLLCRRPWASCQSSSSPISSSRNKNNNNGRSLMGLKCRNVSHYCLHRENGLAISVLHGFFSFSLYQNAWEDCQHARCWVSSENC